MTDQPASDILRIVRQFRSALERRTGKHVRILDPNARMVHCLAPEEGHRMGETGLNPVVVEVISQVELAENQSLVAFLDEVGQAVQQHVQLGGRIAGALGVDQARVARRLAKPEEALEDVEPRPGVREVFQDLGSVVPAEFVVISALAGLEVAENRLLHPLGK